MRYIATTLVLVVALAVAGSAFAATPQAASSAKKSSSAATHTVTGTVKSMDASSLVLSSKKGGNMTFVLDTSTTTKGTPTAGSEVSVHYRSDGSTMVATAITAQGAKQVASAKPASSKKTTK